MQLLIAPFGTYSIRYFSESKPSAALSQRLAALAAEFSKNSDVLDVAIGFTEIVVSYKNSPPPIGAAIELPEIDNRYQKIDTGASEIEGKEMEEKNTAGITRHRIAMDYNGEDLPTIAHRCHLTATEVIQLHSGGTYTIAMIGFKPHFPYLHGLHPQLHLPRRESPRQQVKAGAVAMAAGQAGIYPMDTPGGWHILGYCDPALCKTLRAGDQVIFVDSRTWQQTPTPKE